MKVIASLVAVVILSLIGTKSIYSWPLETTEMAVERKNEWEATSVFPMPIEKREEEVLENKCVDGMVLNHDGVCENLPEEHFDETSKKDNIDTSSTDCPENYVRVDDVCLITRSKIAKPLNPELKVSSDKLTPDSTKVDEHTQSETCPEGMTFDENHVCKNIVNEPRRNDRCPVGMVRLSNGKCMRKTRDILLTTEAAPWTSTMIDTTMETMMMESSSHAMESFSDPIEASSDPMDASSDPIEESSHPLETSSDPMDASSHPTESSDLTTQSMKIEMTETPLVIEATTMTEKI